MQNRLIFWQSSIQKFMSIVVSTLILLSESTITIESLDTARSTADRSSPRKFFSRGMSAEFSHNKKVSEPKTTLKIIIFF